MSPKKYQAILDDALRAAFEAEEVDPDGDRLALWRRRTHVHGGNFSGVPRSLNALLYEPLLDADELASALYDGYSTEGSDAVS